MSLETEVALLEQAYIEKEKQCEAHSKRTGIVEEKISDIKEDVSKLKYGWYVIITQVIISIIGFVALYFKK